VEILNRFDPLPFEIAAHDPICCSARANPRERNLLILLMPEEEVRLGCRAGGVCRPRLRVALAAAGGGLPETLQKGSHCERLSVAWCSTEPLDYPHALWVAFELHIEFGDG
jgi:hypothetical protein